jgi:endonuclease YncB( thermonuclease family)
MGNCQGIITHQCLNKINDNNELDNLKIKELSIFVPPVVSGRVIKVYDGDTITIASRVPGLKQSEIFKFSVRLNGIDTPEMKTHNEDEKKVAKMAQVALSEKIMNKDIILKDVKTEKYGRLLCEIYLDKLHLNQWLIDEKYALPYGGATKIIPTSWVEYHKNGTI